MKAEGKNYIFFLLPPASCPLPFFGEADNLFHDRVKSWLELTIETLAQVLVEAGIEAEVAQIRSQDAIAQIQGALVLVRILDDIEPFERVIKGLPGRLLG